MHECDICHQSLRSEIALANHDRDTHRGGQRYGADQRIDLVPTTRGIAAVLGITPRRGESGDPKRN